MPTLPTDLINAHPGDVVVPLSDMLELLGSRLEESELETISEELIRRRTAQVSAGDVITAELINQILADIGNLQTRVAVLETGIPELERPQIVLVSPNNGVRIGARLEIYGFNLAPERLTSVRMGGRTVSIFEDASHSRMLTFNVPPIFGIPEQGADVNLTIANEYGSDEIMVRVLQSQATELSVAINMQYIDYPEEELEPDSEYTISVRLSALTSMSSEYILTPSISNGDWSVRLTEAANRIIIPRSQPTPYELDFNLVVTTASSGSATLTMRIQAVGHPDQFGEAEPLPLTVGDAVEVNTDISFQTPEIPNGHLDSASGNIIARPGDSFVFAVNALLSINGVQDDTNDPPHDLYDISTPQISGISPDVLSATLLSPEEALADHAGANFQSAIRLSVSGSASGAVAQLQLSINRRGSTEPPANFIRQIVIQP